MAEPERAIATCPSCERTVEVGQLFACAECGQAICTHCLYRNDSFSEAFCSEELCIYPAGETRRIPGQCYHDWVVGKICDWQDKYFALKAKERAA